MTDSNSNSIKKALIQESDYIKYLDELNNYYFLKNKYTTAKDNIISKIIKSDNSIDIKKKLLAKAKFKCVNCGDNAGTVFTESNKILKASCGNSQKMCNLNLEIVKMGTVDIIKELTDTNISLLKTKKSIIATKLDFLFNYIEEDKAIEIFDKLKQELNIYQERYNELYMIYNSITDNKEIEALLNNKLEEHTNFVNDYKGFIDLYAKSNDEQYIKEAVTIYVSKIKDLDKNILDLSYKYNKIEQLDDENLLIQKKYDLSDLELIKKPE